MIRLNAKSKYGAKQVTVNGQRFDSQGEALRFQELCYMALAGEIADLECQVPFILHARTPAGALVAIGKYIADFTYQQLGPEPRRVVEDFKSPGTITPMYRWKKKHVQAEYGIKVTEVMRGRR